MAYPVFYRDIPVLRLSDPLASLLGASDDGVLEYRFEDIVRLTGHACPTVAGAWSMALRGLACLYPSGLPQRGQIQVALRGAQEAGATGVVGAVLGFITGAAGEGGFKGLGGQYGRRGLLTFGVDMDAEVRLTRLDTGESVLLDAHPEAVAPSAETAGLMSRLLGGTATSEERSRFTALWQDRVRRILVDHAEDPALVTCRPDHSMT